jgi:hypothetical protein
MQKVFKRIWRIWQFIWGYMWYTKSSPNAQKVFKRIWKILSVCPYFHIHHPGVLQCACETQSKYLLLYELLVKYIHSFYASKYEFYGILSAKVEKAQ